MCKCLHYNETISESEIIIENSLNIFKNRIIARKLMFVFSIMDVKKGGGMKL